MSRIAVVNPVAAFGYEIDFSTLASLIKGSSILSLADSKEFIEFGLSEGLHLRIEAGADGVPQITVFPVLNSDEVAPVRLQIIGHEEEASAGLIEQRLHSLRQLYSIIFLIDTGRAADLARVLQEDFDADIEGTLLSEEKLYLEAAAAGSFWLTVLTKVKGAPETALSLLALIFGEGRQLILERVRIAKRREEQEVELIVDKRIIGLAKEVDKVKDPQAREIVMRRLMAEMNKTNPALAGPAITLLLPVPAQEGH